MKYGKGLHQVFKFAALITAVVLGAVAFGAVAMQDDSSAAEPMAHVHPTASSGVGGKGADLRVTLNRLLGEHALLAIEATRKGYDGERDFKAAATSLDKNSVELAGAIGSVYGTKARNKFLNGRLMWRDHIKFFVQYTVALKKRDKAGQRRAVTNLQGYIAAFSNFLAQAANLPPNAVRAGITSHVGHLKGQIDAYSRRSYTRAYRLERIAYSHMFETGDTLSGAIVKQFPNRYRG